MFLKRWFNKTFPYHRVCMRRWCWRWQTNQYRCHLHQEW